MVKFHNFHGAAEQRIREGKNVTSWARSSCQAFKHKAARLQLHALAHIFANCLYALALPKEDEHSSLTTLREKFVKIGARIMRHGRYAVLQLAEVAVPRVVFAEFPQHIDRLRSQPPPPSAIGKITKLASIPW